MQEEIITAVTNLEIIAQKAFLDSGKHEDAEIWHSVRDTKSWINEIKRKQQSRER